MDIQSETDVSALLRQWEEEQATPMYDPVPLLTRYHNSLVFFYLPKNISNVYY